MKYVGRFSGIVTYQDGSWDQFAAHIDDNGIVSINGSVTPAVLEVQEDQNWLEGLIDLVSSTLVLSPSGTAAKVVTGMTVNFSGRIARANGTWEDFAVQYDSSAGGSFILNSSGDGSGDVSVYTEFPSSTIQSLCEGVVGSGNVTV